ncbi:flagellar biosynthetic protein FliO [Pseudobdellovibrio exovorus]|uniref:Flagellar protein n=1 Tax=Pseudobdellovibrio exovorus JSS TaxID=1184267 RepID=M4VNX2_9BACT|nr:flagellar biosynthetic protein FliO [Pseudobdellovibrio exovorus]AGH94829.1 polar flagellar assembly protein FliO [Pseudobdellovibrio exovorus JSS]
MMKKFLVFSLICAFLTPALAEDVAAVAAAPAAVVESAAAPKVNTESTAKLSEDQIPLNIADGKKAAESGSATSKALASGVIIAVLLAVTYYYVRRYKFSNTVHQSNMQIKVLTQHYLGPKKSLAIVRVAGESILIGVTDTNISMLKSLSLLDDEIPAEVPESFQASLTQTGGMEAAAEGKRANVSRAAAPEANRAPADMMDELDEEFSFAGVTDTVSKKIKSMRRFS